MGFYLEDLCSNSVSVTNLLNNLIYFIFYFILSKDLFVRQRE